jgi:hypothetical protein
MLANKSDAPKITLAPTYQGAVAGIKAGEFLQQLLIMNLQWIFLNHQNQKSHKHL